MGRSLTFALLVILGASPALAQDAREADYERLFARALELHQSGDILGAIDTYKAALTVSPDRPDALSNLGAAYVRLGQFDDAIEQYEAALQADPDGTAIRLNLALAYYKSARPNEAIPHLRRVVASDPQARNAYLVLADCYLQTGEDQAAVSLLQPREQMFGDDLAYAYVLGTALLQVDPYQGRRYVDRIFRGGAPAEGHLLLGIAYLGRQDFRSAVTELEQAVKLNPRLPTAQSLYGRALLALGNQEDAELAFRRELEVNVNDFHANLQLGNLRRRTERFDEASAYLERAVAIRPADLSARKLLADLRLQTGRTEEAVELLEAIVAEVPDLVEAHVQLATAYNRLKRTDDAERHRQIVDRLNAETQAKQVGR
jgi:tetratricopeptide (TPR) repeat protein